MIIGIDLGTTNSLVAYFSADGPQIIPNSLGERLTPSVVSVDESGEIFVGKIAKERLITHPFQTCAVFKRSMGSKKEYTLGDKKFFPEDLSALIIKRLKEDAEVFLNTTVEEAIISVPAYFNDVQRRATKTAGELAGLKVERIVNEPTAAAIAYGLHEKRDYTKFLVFDLGGGTFDISILEQYQNVMEVRAVAGDNFLGGEDFTQVLVNMFLNHHQLDASTLTKKEVALLEKSAETCKQNFYNQKQGTIACIIDGTEYTMAVSLDEYENNCELLFQRLKKPIVRAITDASIKLNDIDSIILVGGATKLPIVRSFVSKLFGRVPFTNINPDEVVALGAAVQGAMKERNEIIKEIVLTDVCPFTLGTDISVQKNNGFYQSGTFLPIIERNTIIPASKVERLYTVHNSQKMIRVEILQGESRKAKENVYLGEISIPIPIGPAGKEAVDVRYTYDVNGILEVEVTSVSNNETKKMIIEKNPGVLSEAEVAKRLEELASLKIHPRDKEEYRYLLAKGERIYEESVGEKRQYIGRVLEDFENVLEKQEDLEIRAAAKELQEIIRELEQDF